jgi:ABC-type Fe3+-citrate transport system substrate-binding protein
MDNPGAKSSWDDILAKLQQERDALALKLHLGKKEALAEWERLEVEWKRLKAVKGPPIKEAAADTARGVGSALESAATELKKGYEKIRKLL